MTTPDLLHKVAEVVEVVDCGDNGCLFATSKTGMRTNGGCHCLEDAGFHRSTMKGVRQMLVEIRRLRRVLAEHAEVLDAPDSVDVETVRRALAGWASAGDWSHVDVLFAAAAAWLRDHERR